MNVYTIIEQQAEGGAARCIMTFSDPDVALEQLELIARMAHNGEWYTFIDHNPEQDGKFFDKGDESKTEIYIDGKLFSTHTISRNSYNQELKYDK